jgi:hypothetical protein
MALALATRRGLEECAIGETDLAILRDKSRRAAVDDRWIDDRWIDDGWIDTCDIERIERIIPRLSLQWSW